MDNELLKGKRGKIFSFSAIIKGLVLLAVVIAIFTLYPKIHLKGISRTGVYNFVGDAVKDISRMIGQPSSTPASIVRKLNDASSVGGRRSLKVNVDVVMPSFSLNMEDVTVKLGGSDVSIRAQGRDVSLSNQNSIVLNGFSGKLEWTGLKLSLEGHARHYSSENADISFDRSDEVMISTRGLKSLNVEVDDAYLSALSGKASGHLSIGDNLAIKLREDDFTIKNFMGNIKSEYEDGKNRLVLAGDASLIKAGGEEFKVSVE